MRNIGSSIGISLVQTLLVRNTVIAHASLTERITQGSAAWNNPVIAHAYDVTSPAAPPFSDSSVTAGGHDRYIDDFG